MAISEAVSSREADARLHFWKVQSIGNDFPLIRLADVPAERLPQIAIAMADRKFGVGGDGLLAVGPEEGAIRVRMFNPDGTEDFCGNGLRTVVRYAVDIEGAPAQGTLRHLDREIAYRVEGDRISTTIGTASYEPRAIPLLGQEIFDAELWAGMESGMPQILSGSALTTGSTHAIIPVGALPDEDTFRSLSAILENDPKFPDRTSVIWSRRDGERELSIRIWERGVGETQGCGTGSAAAAVDFARRRNESGPITVHNPGGDVTVAFERWDAPITVSGQASIVYEGEWTKPI